MQLTVIFSETFTSILNCQQKEQNKMQVSLWKCSNFIQYGLNEFKLFIFSLIPYQQLLRLSEYYCCETSICAGNLTVSVATLPRSASFTRRMAAPTIRRKCVFQVHGSVSFKCVFHSQDGSIKNNRYVRVHLHQPSIVCAIHDITCCNGKPLNTHCIILLSNNGSLIWNQIQLKQ